MLKDFKTFNESIPFMKRSLSARLQDHLDDDVYAIMTKELSERQKNRKIKSLTHDAYHFKYNNIDELNELKLKYPVGGKYKNETIIQIATLNSKTFGS